MRRLLAIVIFGCVAVGLSSGASAGGRPDKSFKDWFGHLAIGYSLPQGKLGDIVDDDWYINGGATYWPQAWPVGLDFDLAWAEYDATSAVIQSINDQLEPGSTGSVTGGNIDVWSGTINALWSPKKENAGKVGFYLAAGIGAYYYDATLTDTGLVYYPGYCYYWWCYPGGIGTGDYSVASQSSTEFGWNAGVGVTFDVGAEGSQLYLEAKYHSIQTPGEAAEYVPITLGYRW